MEGDPYFIAKGLQLLHEFNIVLWLCDHMHINTSNRHLPNAYICMAYNHKCTANVCPIHLLWIANNLYTMQIVIQVINMYIYK